MIIRLKVFEQTLSIVDTKSVPRKGSKDYLVLQFMFSSDWKDLNKLCYLQKGEVSQPIDVINNLVKVPEWFTQQDHFYITLFGKNDNQEVPTNVVPLRLDKSNTLWEKDAPEPQPSWIVKLIDLNNHPPVPGENGYWMIWDTDSGAYIESDLPQSSVQPDWNQNDDTKPDYVKNRPFYTGDPVETVLVEESTATFTENSGLYMAEFPSTFSATVGEIYNISWDGTVYECTCVTVSEMPFSFIGNLSIIGAGSDTGEPFLAGVANGKGISILTSDTSDSHTFSISKTVVPVVKIDEKYLPDVRSDWNVNDETSLSYVKNRPFYTGDPVETVLLEETTVRFSQNGGIYVGRLSPYTGSFPDEGKIYDVNWDGSIYQCPCYLDGSILTLGVLGNPDPFSIAFLADSSSLGIVTKTANSHTISISGFIDEIVKIDKKYLPELPKLPYMAEENPTGTGAFSLNRMVGSYVGIESFAEGSSTEATGNASHAEGSSTTASGSASHAEGHDTLASGHNSHAEGSYTTAWGNCSHAEGSSLNKAPKMAYGNSSNTTIINKWKSGNFTLAKGLSSHAEGKNVLALGENSHAEGVATFANGDSSHVQGKFNIADDGNLYAHIVGNGTSDASRSNAHTLDWSGNAWFAGNVEGKALIISSSTEGSTKKFKITVDDSGTLTATEVP